jgi:plasmid stability protein
MAQLIIRDLEDEVLQALREMARRRRRTLQQEVREILRERRSAG